MNWTNSLNDYNYNISSSYDPCEFVKHEWLLIKFILISVLGTIVAVCGVIGNALTAAVLTRPNMRTPNNLYITALSLFDVVLLVTAVLLYSIEYIHEFFHLANLYVIWIESVPYVYALINFSQTGSVYITVSVTFERYLAVVEPQLAKGMCNRCAAGLVIGLVTVFAALFNMTKLWEIEVVQNGECTGGFGSRTLAPSVLLRNPWYNKVYNMWLNRIVMLLFPFVLLLIMITAILMNYRKLRTNDAVNFDRDVQNRRRSLEATRIMVMIVVVFLTCNSWAFVIMTMESIYTDNAIVHWAPEFYTFSREAINFLAIVNASKNFLICFVLGDEFRRELLLSCGLRSRRQQRSAPDEFANGAAVVLPI